MGKRKREAREMPDVLHFEPAPISEDRACPFVAYLPSAIDADIKLDGQLYRQSKSPMQTMLVARNRAGKGLREATATFTGTSFAEESQGYEHCCRYALGVLDKLTGKMKLAEVEGGRPIRLTCKPSELSLTPTQAGADEEVGRATEQARKQRLAENFGRRGQKTRLKAVAQRATGAAMDPASVQPGTLAHMQRQVRAAVEQQGPAGAQAEVAAALDARLDLPPHHRDATTAADAYRWQEVCPEGARDLDVADLLRGAADAGYRQGVLQQSGQCADWVLQRLPSLQGLPEGKQRQRVQWLSLLSAVLKLLSAPSKLVGARGGNATEEASIGCIARKLKLQHEMAGALLSKFYTQQNDDIAFQASSSMYMLKADGRADMLKWMLLAAVQSQGGALKAGDFSALLSGRIRLSDALVAARQLGFAVKPAAGTGPKTYDLALLPVTTDAARKTLGDYFPKIDAASLQSRKGKPRGRR